MRPHWIPRDLFRALLRPTVLDRYLMVDGIRASSYIGRCSRTERPLRSQKHQGAYCYRLLDIVARARAEGLVLTNPADPDLVVQLAKARDEIEHLQYQKQDLLDEIENYRHQLMTMKTGAQLSMATLLNEDEIVAVAEGVELKCGVYFLVKDWHVVYVGQSVNVLSRVAQHLGHKDFDKFAYLPCKPEELDLIESLYIHTLRPEQNGRRGFRSATRDEPHAPLSLEQLMQRVVGAGTLA